MEGRSKSDSLEGSCYRGSEHPEQGEWPPAPPSPALGSTLRTAASSHNSFDRVYNKRLQGYTLLLDSRGACIMSRTNEDHDSSYSS